MERSYPADGESLAESPDRFEIWLSEPMRLTLFAASGPEGMVELGESSTGALEEHHHAVPQAGLVPGEYRIVWRGTAASGTASSGGYRFFIEQSD